MNTLKLEKYVEPVEESQITPVPGQEVWKGGKTTFYRFTSKNLISYDRTGRPWTPEECIELEKKHGYVETLTIAYLNKLPIVQWPSHVDQFDPHSAMEIQRLNDVNRAMMNQMLMASRGYGYNDAYQSMLNDMEYFRQLAMTQVNAQSQINAQTSIAYNFEPIKA